MKAFILRHGHLLDLTRGELQEGVDVLVVDGRIAEIGANIKAPSAVESSFDVRGRTVMPGLIDCHVHAMASHVNLAVTARMPNALGIIKSLPILKGMLSRGFTTVRDAGGADWALAQASETGLIDAPRIFPAGKALSQTGGHGDFRARSDQLESCACSFRIASISRMVDGVDDVRRCKRRLRTMSCFRRLVCIKRLTSPSGPIAALRGRSTCCETCRRSMTERSRMSRSRWGSPEPAAPSFCRQDFVSRGDLGFRADCGACPLASRPAGEGAICLAEP